MLTFKSPLLSVSMDFNSNKTESDYVKISPFYNQNYLI